MRVVGRGLRIPGPASAYWPQSLTNGMPLERFGKMESAAVKPEIRWQRSNVCWLAAAPRGYRPPSSTLACAMARRAFTSNPNERLTLQMYVMFVAQENNKFGEHYHPRARDTLGEEQLPPDLERELSHDRILRPAPGNQYRLVR